MAEFSPLASRFVIEIFAKQFFAHERFEIFMRGGYHAHVYFARRTITESVNLSFLQKPKQLRLQRKWQVTNLVEEKRAIFCGAD
jgi:hypothetical protein